VIIDLQKFVAAERAHWHELDEILKKLEADSGFRMDLVQLQHFHRLYERTSSDLAKISTFSSEQEIRGYLESLVSRAYGEIHEAREKSHRFAPGRWFFHHFPATFRRHARFFAFAVALTLLGALFGGFAISMDPEAKEIILPFSHLQGSPSQRVRQEEENAEDRYEGAKTYFSSFLMTHNTQVAITTFALGMTWGIGTIIVLFYNGVILGAVTFDYCLAGETKFLMGWLMPHGVVEIPAILIAGQAGLVLASALIGRGSRHSLQTRLREASGDLVTLIFGVAILLVWAGLVEAFLSQYHEPTIPYWVKIAFGTVELVLLTWFLSSAGRTVPLRKEPED